MGELETITLTRTTAGIEPRTAEFVVPRQLGAVRLRREIGLGGMGVVWLGRDELLARDVAVKFLLNAIAGPDDPGFVRFIAGARAAGQARHAGLTTVHQADVVAGIPYLIMEYVDGPSLSQVRKRCGPLPLADVVAVLDTVADAVGALHERGIVHQDIKPGNVLLNAEGQAFVTDFGLTHVHTARTGAAPDENAAGTPPYMAPEMLAGVVSARSDVYALAVMTFELLCGELPYAGTLTRLREQHSNAPLPIQRLEQCGVGSDLIDVLERAAHKDAVFRHKTAHHFLRAVRDTCPEWPGPAIAARRLATLVARCRTTPDADGAHASEISECRTPTSYYDTLSARAAAKRLRTGTSLGASR